MSVDIIIVTLLLVVTLLLGAYYLPTIKIYKTSQETSFWKKNKNIKYEDNSYIVYPWAFNFIIRLDLIMILDQEFFTKIFKVVTDVFVT
jgi:hypothetical protein